jgi:hypothetical protein
VVAQASIRGETYCVHLENIERGCEKGIGVVGNLVRQCFSRVAGHWKWSDH